MRAPSGANTLRRKFGAQCSVLLVWSIKMPSVRAHAPNCSATDCDECFIEKKLLSIGSVLHVCVKEEE